MSQKVLGIGYFYDNIIVPIDL